MILLANPGRQHADQLAAALLAEGCDATLIHGSPIRRELRTILATHSRRWPATRVVAHVRQPRQKVHLICLV